MSDELQLRLEAIEERLKALRDASQRQASDAHRLLIIVRGLA